MMSNADEERKNILLICNLVGFLINQITRDQAEWDSWGKEFVANIFLIQFDDEKGKEHFCNFEKNWIRDFENLNSLISLESHFEDYVKVFQVDSIENILSCFDDVIKCPSQDLSSALINFYRRMYAFLASEKSSVGYDARYRICVKALAAMSSSLDEFDQSELQYWHSMRSSVTANTTAGTEVGVDGQYMSNFNSAADSIPRSSVLSSFRLWKVAFMAAAGGGAMLAATNPGLVVAGILLSPSCPALIQQAVSSSTVMSYLLSLIPFVGPSALTNSVSAALTYIINLATSIPQMSAVINASQFASSLPAVTAAMNSARGHLLLTQTFGGYGAVVAGSRMLRRTAPLKIFLLEPLHIPSVALPTECGDNSETAALTSSDCDLLVVDRDRCPRGLAVRILVCGHCDAHSEPRMVWGATGLASDLQLSAVAEITPSDSSGDGTSAAATTNVLSEGTDMKSTAAEVEVGRDAMSKGADISGDWQELVEVSEAGWWQRCVSPGEEYLLFWEEEVLRALSSSMQAVLSQKIHDKLRSIVMDKVLQFTPISVMKAAAKLPLMVLDKLKELDDPWLVAMDRTQQAGRMLAKVLLTCARQDQSSSGLSGSGRRPVTLCGYGMGARVVFHCLIALAEEGGVQARGIIENAVLIGAPLSSGVLNLPSWHSARTVVAGRFINCYARSDWLLALLYRSKSYDMSIAGLCPVHLKSTHANLTSDPNSTSSSTSGCSKDVDDNGSLGTKERNECSKIASSSSESAALCLANVDEVENIDVSGFISSHSDYPNALPKIFEILRL